MEPFAPTLAVVRVPGAAAPDFLRAAVDLCNGRLWGTLSCTLLVPPDAQRDHAQAVEQVRCGTPARNPTLTPTALAGPLAATRPARTQQPTRQRRTSRCVLAPLVR